MFHKAAIAAAALSVVSAPALAQGFTGGTIGVEVDAPTDLDDFGGTTYFLGGEYAINRSFSVSGDLSSYRFDNLDEDATSATIHGIYHLSDSASAGLFIGQDSREDDDGNIYGLEYGTEFRGGFVEAYLGKFDGDASDATFLGASGAYALGRGFALTGDLGRVSGDDSDVNRIALGAGYTIQAGPELYGEIGRISIEDGGVSTEDTYIGLGARIQFGAARGTTFDRRSIFEILPQF